MNLSIEWQHDAPNASPEEKATAADWRWIIQNENACRHIIDSELSETLTTPLYSIINGITHDWWKIFGSRSDNDSFSLYRHRCGYALPEIKMEFDGKHLEAQAIEHIYSGTPEIRFLSCPSELLNRATAEKILSDMIEQVLTRLRECGVNNTSAELRWKRVNLSRQDTYETAFCEAAGALGEDPYQINEDAAQIIEQASSWFQGDAMLEFLSGVNRSHFDKVAKWITAAESRPTEKSALYDIHSLSTDVINKAPVRTLERSWALGYRRARAFRSTLGLDERHRFRRLADLATTAGAANTFAPIEKEVDNLLLLRSEGPDDNSVNIHMRKLGGTASAFTFARGVGDVMCFPEKQKAVVNDLRNAYRQAAGRAFAAELLAPINEIKNMRNDGKDRYSIAKEFGVSVMVVERQMDNAWRIQAACQQ